MKKLLICICAFALLSVVYCVTYYQSYRRVLQKVNRQSQLKENSLTGRIEYLSNENQELLKELARLDKEPLQANASETTANNEASEAGRLSSATILPGVTYVEEIYQVDDSSLTSVIKTAPGYLIGMTRDELIQYTKDYMDSLPLSEYEAGLLAVDLISFSENRVVLRKTYNEAEVPFKYFVNITRGMVTVYYSDKTSVYEYTHIPAVELPEELREDLTEGIYLKNREELYALLEGCSS